MFFSWGALAWLLDGTLMLIVATVMVAYDWVLALVAFVVAAPLGFVLRRVQHHLLRAYERARVDNAEVLTTVSEVVSGAETLRVYGAGPRYAESTKRASARRSKSFVRAGTIGAFLFPSGEVFSVLTVAAVVAVGVVRGPASGLTAGAMVGFVFLTYRFLEPIAEFTEVIDQTQTAVAGLRRVLGVLDLPIGPPEPRHPQALPSGALGIDIEHVTFTYPSRGDDDEAFIRRLQGLDLEVVELLYKRLTRVHDLEEDPDVNPAGVTMEMPEGRYLRDDPSIPCNDPTFVAYKEAALVLGEISAEEFDRWVKHESMLGPLNCNSLDHRPQKSPG
jgi:ABC-type multidrug transport system fused ATPase/permease subunit